MPAKDKKHGFLKKWLRLIVRVVLFLFTIHLLYLILLIWVMPPITLTQISGILAGDGYKQKNIYLKNINPQTALAFIASEDQRFAEHNGFDWESIQKAIEHNKENPDRVRGASTISQQVAKNVFLWQGRSWFRKGLEVYSTFMIELFWSKRRILEIYLNVAETGRGIYGIEAAAQHYFRKPASKLTNTEAARIVACLPNPKVYSVAKPGPFVKRRTQWILRQMQFLRGEPNIESLLFKAQTK
jgi:monofunctional biosynthetic peptidoglycan transglycosylase